MRQPSKPVLFILAVAVSLFHACSPGGQEKDIEELNTLIDNWHKAAATADEEAFFGFMTDDCIYLGTDKTEKWKRDELRMWSEKYFQRESAWSFKPTYREIYFSDDGNTAWFDERLDTWMGVCKGSGVVVRTGDTWKLSHYNLAVTVPNEKIDDFLDLVDED